MTPSKLVGVLALWSILVLPLTAKAEMRTWTSQDGTYSTQAELVSASNSEVRLKKANGKTITVPLARLSDADAQYVKTWSERNATQQAGFNAPEGKAAAKTGQGAPAGVKLAPLKFKIFDDEYTIQVPPGAKAETEGVFPAIRAGNRFKMSIQPASDSDWSDFKERFSKPSDAIRPVQTLLEEKDAMAYKVNVKAFNEAAWVYLVRVPVGEKTLVCFEYSFDEINQKEKLTPKDVQLMVYCARTIQPASGPAPSGD